MTAGVFSIESTPLAAWSTIALRLSEHLAYLNALREQGTILISGPHIDSTGEPVGSGLTIIRADSAEHARQLAEEDPLVVAGLRSVTVRRWRLSVVGDGIEGLPVSAATQPTTG